MAKRTSLLGRSRPSERLTREEIAVLDKVTLPPEPPPKPHVRRMVVVRSGWSPRTC